MKSRIFYARIVCAILIPLSAQAEVISRSGTYEEARIAKMSGEAPAVVAAHGSASNSPEFSIKGWVKSQVQSVRQLVGFNPPVVLAPKAEAPIAAPAAFTAPIAQERKTASEPSVAASVTASASAPSVAAVSVPTAPATADVASESVKGFAKNANGVASYDITSSPSIPRLHLEKEPRLDPSMFALNNELQQKLDDRLVRPLVSPSALPDTDYQAFLKSFVAAKGILPVHDGTYAPQTKLILKGIAQVDFKLRPELELKLKNFKQLTFEESQFLSGLLLMQSDHHCNAAIGLFHSIAAKPGWEAEANYFESQCSRELGLMTDFYDQAGHVLATQDPYYSKKILNQLGEESPYELNADFGAALVKISQNAAIMADTNADVKANLAFMIANIAAETGHFDSALVWAKQVPSTHKKFLQARFIEAIAEYQVGSKDKAEQIQTELLALPATSESQTEFQALVALNAARIYFQNRKFKDANQTFIKVDKEQTLWLQSLTELGWSQLMSGDYEGAIGNMYSIQSPFFKTVYKPESYVIRTIGYISLCQYGDAYRTLSLLEREYRPQLDKVDTYLKERGEKSVYQTVRAFLAAPHEKGAKPVTEVEGLPVPVIREIARHREFTKLQKAYNREVDERASYSKVDGEVEHSLKMAQTQVTQTRKHIDELRKKIASISKHNEKVQFRAQWVAELDQSFTDLNNKFFQVDLFTAAQTAMQSYRKDVVQGADRRMATIRTNLNAALVVRLDQVRAQLNQVLDNNELLRYEVFSDSGENLRFQVAGGEKANRVPANVLPKSKSLQWDFDGEFWEDEIGHYRSSLKNNCPEGAQAPSQASADGGHT